VQGACVTGEPDPVLMKSVQCKGRKLSSDGGEVQDDGRSSDEVRPVEPA